MTPSTAWKEQIAADEPVRFERYAEQLRHLQRRRARNGTAHRGLHAKGTIGLEASFTVHGDLPEHARVALFAQPATYKALVRFSNGSPHVQHDRKPDVRGVAIKLLGVPGKKIIPGLEGATTQDFLLIRSRSQPFRNADEFVPFVRTASQPWLLPSLFFRFGPGRVLELLKTLPAGLKLPMNSLATTSYFTALPSQLGPYAVRYALVPELADAAPLSRDASDHLADELGQRLKTGPVTYSFRAQFFVDEARTPIEDASVDWDDAVSPWVNLGTLTLTQQDPRSPRGQKLAAYIETLAFDPWHALAEMRPLGNMMRARNVAYRLSTSERHAASEPDATPSFD